DSARGCDGVRSEAVQFRPAESTNDLIATSTKLAPVANRSVVQTELRRQEPIDIRDPAWKTKPSYRRPPAHRREVLARPTRLVRFEWGVYRAWRSALRDRRLSRAGKRNRSKTNHARCRPHRFARVRHGLFALDRHAGFRLSR